VASLVGNLGYIKGHSCAGGLLGAVHHRVDGTLDDAGAFAFGVPHLARFVDFVAADA
jgi:hypothetical protein